MDESPPESKWMVITILFPEFILSKAVCEFRLALNDLHQFDMVLEDNGAQLEWVSTQTPPTETEVYRILEQYWSWKVEYGPWMRTLYRILELPPPRNDSQETREQVHQEHNNATEMGQSILEDDTGNR
jgi:hypothetical protein